MESHNSPTLCRRRLSAELRRLREARSLTATAAAKLVHWPTSKITRIERAEFKLISVPDVAALLDAYQVAAGAERDALIRLARESRERRWWHSYSGLSDDYTTYVGFEAAARVVRCFEPLVVPALLQTADYARALIRGRLPDLPDRELADRVEVMLERQARVLSGPDSLRMWAIIDESVLYRQIGGPDVMRAQREQLRKFAEIPNITVQVLPFAAGFPVGCGPFAIVTFHEDVDPEVVYAETDVGEFLVESRAGVEGFKLRFEQLIMAATTRDETLKMLSRAVARS